jgi:glycosyltransferase involved in cell wall biosynthesis
VTGQSGKPSLWIATTVPMMLDVVLRGQPAFLSDYLDVTLVSSPGPLLEHVGEREGVPTIGIRMTRRITPVRDSIAIVRVWRTARRLRPDAVHSYTPKAGLVMMVGARLAGVRVRIHSVVGLPLTESRGFKQRVLKVVESVTYRNATLLLCNSHELAEHLGKLFPPQTFHVVAQGTVDGIDGERFDPSVARADMRKELGIDPQAMVFAYVGRVVPHKGIRELVEAFRELGPDSYLLVVGDLDGEAGPPAAVQAEMRSSSRVRWVGFQDDVRPYLAAADILVHPSYREGLPQAILEAAAMEVPAIATDISGCREATERDDTAWLVPPKDAAALRAAMTRSIHERDRLADMGRRARTRVLRLFAQRPVREGLLDVYLTQTSRNER